MAWSPLKLSLYPHRLLGYKDPKNMATEALKLPLL